MRVSENKRNPFMTARKGVALVVAFMLLVTFLIVMYYRNIQADVWNEQQYVKSSLREYFVPSTIDYAQKYVWDDEYWIVKGKTEQDIEKYVVWQDLNIVLSSPTVDLINEQDILNKLKEDNSVISIAHTQPAFFRGILSYEVQTKKASGHTIYTFYSMEDGHIIDQFTLPK